jgi:hypothetical protein
MRSRAEADADDDPAVMPLEQVATVGMPLQRRPAMRSRVAARAAAQ